MKIFATYKCSALGGIFWTMKYVNLRLTLTRDVRITLAEASVGGRSRLIIDNALERDDGTYMCEAENPAGVRRAIAAVRVQGQTTHHAPTVLGCFASLPALSTAYQFLRRSWPNILVCYLGGLHSIIYAKTTLPIFTKLGGKAADGPRKQPLDFGGNLTLGSGL